MTPVEARAVEAYMEKFPNVFEIVDNRIYFIDRSISNSQLFIKRLDNEFLFLDNYNIYVKLSRIYELHSINVPRDFNLSDATCVSVFDSGIDIMYYDQKNNVCLYDQDAIRRRHTINNIINE